MRSLITSSLCAFITWFAAHCLASPSALPQGPQPPPCRPALVAGYHRGHSCSLGTPLSLTQLPSASPALRLLFQEGVVPLWTPATLPGGLPADLGLLEVDVTWVRVVEARALPRTPGLRQLQLLHSAAAGDARFGVELQAGAFENLGGLETLVLSDLRLSALTPGLLRGLTALTLLDLSHNRLRAVPAGALGDCCAGLVGLALGRNAVERLEDVALPRSLRRLDIHGNAIRTLTADSFGSARDSLMDLNLGQNGINSMEPGALAGLSQLESLDLHGSALRDISETTLARLLAPLANIKVLDLGDSGIASLHSTTFSSLVQLKTLSLRSNRLREISDELFVSLHRLEQLDLGANLLTRVSPRALWGLAHLQRLLLDGNSIDALAGGALDALRGPAELSLRANRLKALPRDAFSNETWAGVVALELGDNPWHCDCEALGWLLREVRSGSVGQAGAAGTQSSERFERFELRDESAALCDTPGAVEGKALLAAVVESCFSPSTLTTNLTQTPPQTRPDRTHTLGPMYTQSTQGLEEPGSHEGQLAPTTPHQPPDPSRRTLIVALTTGALLGVVALGVLVGLGVRHRARRRHYEIERRNAAAAGDTKMVVGRVENGLGARRGLSNSSINSGNNGGLGVGKLGNEGGIGRSKLGSEGGVSLDSADDGRVDLTAFSRVGSSEGAR